MIRTTLKIAALLFAVRARHSLLAVRRASPSYDEAALRVLRGARHGAWNCAHGQTAFLRRTSRKPVDPSGVFRRFETTDQAIPDQLAVLDFGRSPNGAA